MTLVSLTIQPQTDLKLEELQLNRESIQIQLTTSLKYEIYGARINHLAIVLL